MTVCNDEVAKCPTDYPEPSLDACDGLAHLVGRTRIGKANEPAAMQRIEVDAGGRRDVRLSSICWANSKLSEVNTETSHKDKTRRRRAGIW